MLVSDIPVSFWHFKHDETDHKSSSHIITAMSWAIIFTPLSIYVSLFSDAEQHMQQSSFSILCGCLLVFFFFGNITTIILIYLRAYKSNSLVLIILQQLKFVPVVSLFFSGILYHIFNGLARHMFGMAAEWGATTKEMEVVEYSLTLFFTEVRDTIKRFWFMYILVVLYSLGWAVWYLLGPDWLEWSGIAMLPFVVMIVSHAFMPILLNPNAMYSLYYGLKAVLCCETKQTTEGTIEAKKELQDDDDSITWPDEDLESGNIFEFEVESGGHSNKSRTSKSADHAGMDGESKHTNKSRTSKSADHAGVDVSVNNTPPISGPLRQRRPSRDFDSFEAI
jgi:hypothetical protein